MADVPCCAPREPRGAPIVEAGNYLPAAVRERAETDAMIALDGGEFRFGSDDQFAYPDDGEGPVRPASVQAFRIDCHAVSNERFAAFIDATGHITDAERFGWSFVFAGLLPDDFPPTRGVAQAPWWRAVEGASWDHPFGPQSGIDELLDHPVVHVSHNDVGAYCAWAGTRLPTEAEWEFAARGGLEGQVFPWGDQLEPDGEHRMNVWQGEFPSQNTLADGHYGTCAVGEYPPNGYGLHNVTGNVWEWTADWFDPRGRQPATGTHRVQKGGSYLCHESYCRRYRVAARQANTPDASAGNLGFRCSTA